MAKVWEFKYRDFCSQYKIYAHHGVSFYSHCVCDCVCTCMYTYFEIQLGISFMVFQFSLIRTIRIHKIYYLSKQNFTHVFVCLYMYVCMDYVYIFISKRYILMLNVIKYLIKSFMHLYTLSRSLVIPFVLQCYTRSMLKDIVRWAWRKCCVGGIRCCASPTVARFGLHYYLCTNKNPTSQVIKKISCTFLSISSCRILCNFYLFCFVLHFMFFKWVWMQWHTICDNDMNIIAEAYY